MLSGFTDILLLGDFDWDGHMDMDGGGWVLMAIGMVLFWALVALAIVWLVRELGSSSRGAGADGTAGPPDPVAILARRFAEGEISVEEYRERVAVLEGKDSGAG